MPLESVSISRVRSVAEHRAFCELPYVLYRDDPLWVPPLRRQERRRWSTRYNASLKSRWVERFIAWRGSDVVGRVAAIRDDAFATRWEPHSGFFGFFESIDDPAVARALLGCAESALHGHGTRRVFGPVNLTTNDEVGLLVKGFSSRPMLLSPYNPPWYEALLSGAGYVPRIDYHSFGWDVDRPIPDLHRVARGPTQGGVHVRRSNPKHWAKESRALLDVYNASFVDVWGFVPLSWEEYEPRAKEFRRFYRPELVSFAEVNGRVVGFALALPDINEALITAEGRLWPFGWLRLARAVSRIRSARFILLGVHPEFAGLGIAPLLSYELVTAAREIGLKRVELSLVQEANERVQRIIVAFGGRQLKKYRLFEKTI